jgi:hypothetical protein
MKDVLYRYTQVSLHLDCSDDRRNRMNIVGPKTLPTRETATRMTLTIWELRLRQSIITESCHILLNHTALPNSTVTSMIEIPVKIPSDPVLEDPLCSIRHNCYLIELPHFTPDRIHSTTSILLRSSFKFR